MPGDLPLLFTIGRSRLTYLRKASDVVAVKIEGEAKEKRVSRASRKCLVFQSTARVSGRSMWLTDLSSMCMLHQGGLIPVCDATWPQGADVSFPPSYSRWTDLKYLTNLTSPRLTCKPLLLAIDHQHCDYNFAPVFLFRSLSSSLRSRSAFNSSPCHCLRSQYSVACCHCQSLNG